jgi:FkbM family methyltransferase
MGRRAAVRPALRRYTPRSLRSQGYQLRRLGTRGYLRRAWRSRVMRQAPEPEADAPFDIGAPVPIILHASTLNGVKSHWLDRGGGTAELDAFKRLAPGHSTFLDIGAAGGIFAAAFCAFTGGRAYAFEPSPGMYMRLTALRDTNPSFDIEPFQIALGAVSGVQPMLAHGPQFRGVADAEAGTMTISVQTLDDFAAAHQLKPDFAKIDVEGMELEVLRGGASTFGSSVDAIMLEVHPRMLAGEHAVSEMQALLVELGFALFTLELEPITDLAEQVRGPRGTPSRAMNIVCRRTPAR